jgi:hypothetical protein
MLSQYAVIDTEIRILFVLVVDKCRASLGVRATSGVNTKCAMNDYLVTCTLNIEGA